MRPVYPNLFSDSYKQFHVYMYVENLIYLNSNLTARKSRLPGITNAIWYGLQGMAKEYLIEYWNTHFFQKSWDDIHREYQRFHKYFSGAENIDDNHWKHLHKLGYLPIKIKALREGSRVPIRVPFMVIENTHDDFAWLVNFLETGISAYIWDQIVVATIADDYKKIFTKYANETSDNSTFVQFQGHDFSMRGRYPESGRPQSAHLLSFVGTDTIPAVYYLEEYYNARMEDELIGCSVPATEHSVMMCGGVEDEIGTFEDLIKEFPDGILSIVSDTWDLWKVLQEYLVKLRAVILKRNGKIVIRPDSGDPADILCGNPEGRTEAEKKGVVELLHGIFGGTLNSKGYIELHPNIGCIYGDAITREVATDICERLKAKGFASTNWVAGVGSYTYNYNTRDTLGMAIKATHCRVRDKWVKPEDRDQYNEGELNNGYTIQDREIFKDPITDNSGKKSAKGLLAVYEENGELVLKEQCTMDEYNGGLLLPVFENSKLLYETSLKEIRKYLEYTLDVGRTA